MTAFHQTLRHLTSDRACFALGVTVFGMLVSYVNTPAIFG